MNVRIGQGVDTHAFADGAAGALVLGGVEIPDGPPLAGHSDGDVVLHAVADALLGAVAGGDLGRVFGTADPRHAGIASGHFVTVALARCRAAGWRVANLDATVIAARPLLAPHLPAMAGHIAGLLDVRPDAVCVKATTTDGLGFTGRGEGVACLAVVLLERPLAGAPPAPA